MSENNKKLLIMMIGFAAAALCYFLVFRPTQTANAAMESENAALTAKVTELQGKIDNEQFYQDEITRIEHEINLVLNNYPSYLTTENVIMDVVDLEQTTGAVIPSVSFSDAAIVDVAAYGEDGTAASASSEYTLNSITTSVTFTSTYSGLKTVLSAISGDSDKRSVESVSVTFDNSTGNLSGSLVYNTYYIFGQDKDYVSPDIPSIQHGTDNLFGTVEYDSQTEAEAGAQTAEAGAQTEAEAAAESDAQAAESDAQTAAEAGTQTAAETGAAAQ